MKKKILTFLFAICLILPCAFIMTACKDNPPSDPPPPNPPGQSYSINVQGKEGVWLTEQNADSCFGGEPFDLKSGETYAIWISDYYDKYSLDVYFDENSLSLNLLENPDYENKLISHTPQKVATITLPTITEGVHNISYSVEEEEIEIKFVADVEEFSEDQLEVLENWCLPSADGENFKNLMGTDFALKTTYTELTSAEGIKYTCNNPFGYYLTPAIFQSVNSEYMVSSDFIGGNNHNEFSFGISSDNGYTNEIELTFDKSVLYISTLEITGNNANNKILKYVDGDESYVGMYTWSVDNANDIKIYLENYEGVDLEEVEVFIYDTQMELELDEGKKYFTIPKGKLPIEYFEGTINEFLLSNTYGRDFPLTIKNVDVSNTDLYTQFELTNNNVGVTVEAYVDKYFTSQDGTIYYIPNSQTSVNCNFNVIADNMSITINGSTTSLDSYMVVRPELDEDDTQDAYRYGNFDYYYNNVSSDVTWLHVEFDEDYNVIYMHIEFRVTGNTTVEIICN